MKLRLLTALCGIVLVLGAVGCPRPWPYLDLLVLLVAIVGLSEYRSLQKDLCPGGVGAVAGMVAFGVAALAQVDEAGLKTYLSPAVAGTALSVLTLAGGVAAYRAAKGPPRAFWREAGALWVVAPLASATLYHRLPMAGHAYLHLPLLMALLPTWAGDSAAIFVGRAIGHRPLAPTISPKKTVEGAWANLAACVALAWLVGRVLGLSWPIGLACGLACGTVGQAGDLFESALKRASGKKDSGTLLPGHGGLLDRIDSLLFALPVVLLILALSPPPR